MIILGQRKNSSSTVIIKYVIPEVELKSRASAREHLKRRQAAKVKLAQSNPDHSSLQNTRLRGYDEICAPGIRNR